MTIAIVTYIDCAKTAERIAAALKAHSGHRVTCVDQRYGASVYKRAIADANIIWVMGDSPPELVRGVFSLYYYNGKKKILKASGHKALRNAKIIYTPYGSSFRRPIKGYAKAYGLVPLSRFKNNSDIIATITPDLNYPELGGIYYPHANNTDAYKNNWSRGDIITVGAYHAQADCKHVKSILMPAVKIAKDRGCKIEVKAGSRMPHKDFMKLIGGCTLYYDQITPLGIYAYSGVEAMSMGVPVIAGISETAKKQATPMTNYGEPCLKAYDIVSLADLLTDIWRENVDLQAISAQSRDYAVAVHSYQSAAKRAEAIIGKIEGR